MLRKVNVEYLIRGPEDEMDLKAHMEGPKLALCIWEVLRDLTRVWELAEEGSLIEKKIDELREGIYERIGDISEYTC